MQIRFLGTAAAEATPAFFCDCPVCTKAAKAGGRNIRTRSQVLINEDLLIDYPPDTYFHVIAQGLDLKKVGNLLITHSHEDHFLPHDMMMNGFPNNAGTVHHQFHCYGNQKVTEILKPFAQDIRNNAAVHEVRLFEEMQVGGYRVIPLRAKHDPNEDCLLYAVQGQDNKRFLLGNDTGFFPQDTMERIRGIVFDAIALDCTTGKDRDGNNHMGFEDDLDMRTRLLENGNANEQTQWIAQHFSHNGGYVYEDAVKRMEPEGFTVAYDGMAIKL